MAAFPKHVNAARRLPARLLRADFPEAFSHHAHAFMVFGVRVLPNTRPAA